MGWNPLKRIAVVYYYFFLVYAVGLSSLSSCSSDTPDDQGVEDIDEADDENDFFDHVVSDGDADYCYEQEVSEIIDSVDQREYIDSDNVCANDADMDENNGELLLPAKRWAMIMVFDGYTKAPIVNKIAAWSVMTELVTFSGNGSSLVSHHTMCSIEVDDESALIEAEVPSSFYRSLPVVDKPVVLSEDRGIVHFHQPIIYEHRSCIAYNPSDDLPVDADDPRVQDWDQDGVPGLKMYAKGTVSGDVSLCQKISTVLDGSVYENRIEGLVDWHEWQQVYEYSNELLKNGSPTFPGEDPSRSYFYMVPLDDADADCDYILEHRQELFGNKIPAPGK